MNRLSFSQLKSLVCLMVVALFLFAGGGTARAQTVVVAQGIDPEALDPQASVNIATMSVNSNIFDKLLGRDKDLNLQLRLATSYEPINPTTWRFELREGVTFHNGEPFNAESVKFSFERIYAPDSTSHQKGWFSTIDRVEIVDDYTVDIITKQPDPILPARLTLFFIVPPKYIQEVGDTQFNLHPVGTGAFKFVEWIQDAKLVLERFDDFWEGPPEIEKLIFRPMPETQSRIAALQTGEVDVAVNIPPDLAMSLRGQGDFDFKSALTTRVVYVYLSTHQESPLQDQRVRQAINYAINRDELIEYVLEGYGEPIASFVPKMVMGHNPDLKPYPYDPEKAKQLLAEAGYPNGFEVEMHGMSGRFARDKEMCQAMAGQLSQVGINVDLKIVEWGSYIDEITNHRNPPMYYLGWSLPGLDPDLWLWPSVHSGEKFSQTNDPEFDRMIEEARFEMDPKKREMLYHEAVEYLHEKAYFAVIYQLKALDGVSNRIDYTPRADEMIFMWDVKIVE